MFWINLEIPIPIPETYDDYVCYYYERNDFPLWAWYDDNNYLTFEGIEEFYIYLKPINPPYEQEEKDEDEN